MSVEEIHKIIDLDHKNNRLKQNFFFPKPIEYELITIEKDQKKNESNESEKIKEED